MGRIAGVIFLKSGGEQLRARGNFTYGLGGTKAVSQTGATQVEGYSEEIEPAYIAGEIFDDPNLDVAALKAQRDVHITLELGNGKVISLPDAWQVESVEGGSQEGNLGVRWEGARGFEV